MRTDLRLGAVAAAAIAASLASASALAAPATRANAPQIRGEVVDREGAAVAGVTVIAKAVKQIHHRAFSTITDAAGRFHLDGLPAGSYWFIALDSALAAGSTPALPVSGHLEVVIRLDDEVTRA